MAEVQDTEITSPIEMVSVGRRHLAVKDYNSAVETLANACEQLAKEHGDTADECAEAYLWYGKALLGLSREESGVLGDGMPGTADAEEEDSDDDDENGDNNEEQNDGAEVDKDGEPEKTDGGAEKEGTDEGVEKEHSDVEKQSEEEKDKPVNGETEKTEAESTKEEPSSSKPDGEPGTSNGEANDESVANLDNEDDIDNLQLAWEMLDLSRSILYRRVQDGGGDAARTLLADVHLALGEVALESETYDKAVVDMQSCLDLQKGLYRSDDRRIAETHYQIGLANSLASNFEDAITHFKNAANILQSRIKTLENPTSATEDATVKKYASSDPFYSVEGEIKELKELLPEIQEKIQDMMDYKAETIKRVRETLCPSNGEGFSSNGAGDSAAGSSSAPAPKAATNISHLIKRKRKSSDTEESSSAKRANT